MASDNTKAPAEYEHRVDPGALALATVAGAVAFIFGGGDWDALACVIGSMLVIILLAHHRAAPSFRTPRAYFLRAAFGVTTGLAFCIAVAPVIQFGIVEPFYPEYDEEGYLVGGAWTTTMVISVLWVIVATLLAVLEPRIARRLDKPLRGKRNQGNANDPSPSGRLS